ncbi:MAG: DUF2142 domain-containing protein, partial [Solirubrobacterales bacterium]|nr:DUF2142 domain-containing protein [Solirubrobacterales bacterium]
MRRLAVLGVAIAALLSAWIAATRPFGAPDEVDHYLRAAGIANGQLLGPKVPWLDPRLPAAQNRWAGLDARAARVSLQSSPPGRTCIAGTQRGGLRGSCLEATHTGDYQPLPYLLPAFSLAVTHGVGTGLWVSRASSALQCLAFLVLAMALLWSGEALSLLGFLAAVSPQVLFICAVLNPNGLEVAAGSAFAAGLLRISRAPARASAWVWAAVAISGCVTVLSWQLGPAFVAFDLALFASLCGRGKWAQARLTHPVALAATGLVILVSLALYLTYGLSSGALHSPFALTPVGPNLRLGLTQLAPLA